MNGQLQNGEMNNELKSTWKRFDDAVMVGPNDRALDVYRFVNVAVYLAIVLNPIRVHATMDINRWLWSE